MNTTPLYLIVFIYSKGVDNKVMISLVHLMHLNQILNKTFLKLKAFQ